VVYAEGSGSLVFVLLGGGEWGSCYGEMGVRDSVCSGVGLILGVY
jgi:hypothetical protein